MTDGARPMNATIEDVARLAGVSRAAVSKVLRDAYGVSDSMRQRVNAAIEDLDYRPRTAARAMRGRSYTIGIEIPDFSNQFFARVLAGARLALLGTRYQLLIAPADAGPREGYRALEALIDQQVDAVVAVSPLVDQGSLDRIARSTPVVMFGRHDRSDHYDTVAGDDGAGATAIMSHLFSLGHQRIAHLSLAEPQASPLSATPHGIRLATYLGAMKDGGFGDFIRVERVTDGEEPAYAATRSMLRGDDRPTAIFAAHDALAIGALRAVIEEGLEVSVVGYDGVPIASHPALSLTTADQPGEVMGQRAMGMLLERLSGRTSAVHEVFTPQLMVRRSSRPVGVGVTS